MIEQDIVYRVRTRRVPGTLAKALAAIARFGAQIGEIVTLTITPDYNVREVTVIAPGDADPQAIADAIASVPGVELLGPPVDRVFETHRGGKLRVIPSVEVRNLQHVREVYTPGVARVSQAIAEDPELADELTWRPHTLAIVTDGTRVLGLGDVGPAAALPVMEGKALFYAKFVELNAVPICLDTTDPDEIVETVIRLAPSFGGIHLEDIATPGVFHVEDELDRRLDIPVFHDDQHGTAVVVMAAVLNAARRVGKRLEELRFGQVGLGAAGSAIALLASGFPFAEIIAFDPKPEAAERLRRLASGDVPITTLHDADGAAAVFAQADVVVMTTGRPHLVPADWVQPGQIVLALTNPVPEIEREAALAAGAAVAMDGSLVNNVLAYPGIFRGTLDARVSGISLAMKRAAAETIAEMAPAEALLPDPLDRTLHLAVAAAVRDAARPTED